MTLPLSPPTPSPALPLPLDAERRALLQRLTEGLDPATLWWVSGYLAGLAAPQARGLDAVLSGATALHGLPAAVAGPAVDTLTVVYGSQTGNAKRAAEALFAEAGAKGLKARLLRADAYPLAELKRETQLVVVISTQGDGDPPDDARGFVEHLLGRRAPKLEGLRYAVLGLGDSSYAKFCEIGRVLDARLAELGGLRLAPLGEADVDIDTVANPWRAAVLRALEALRPAGTGAASPALPRAESVDAPAAAHADASLAATREAPVQAELLANTRLTGRGSDRDTRHLEFAIDPATLDYVPGDAAGVWPVQAPALVEAILEATRLDGDARIEIDGHALPLRAWLGERRELTRLNRPLLKAHAERSDSARLAAALADASASAALLQRTPLLDLLQEHPGAWTAPDFVRALRPLAPRLYSIASSREAVGDELHLTVGHEVFEGRDGLRYGAASHYLATLKEGDSARLFIERNERFRLPHDASRDVIMIGPGTGVAPFRGFVQHRAASGASGRNWLFFGNPHFRSDFLYQVEWQKALKAGTLHRLDLAFSRDGALESPHRDVRALVGDPHKVYVQHRLAERGAELWAWLQAGAHLYVCGDASRMAKDVHATLLDIAQTHGGLDAEAAADYFTGLEKDARYARDVY